MVLTILITVISKILMVVCKCLSRERILGSKNAGVVRNALPNNALLTLNIFLKNWDLTFYKRSNVISFVTPFGEDSILHSDKICTCWPSNFLFFKMILSQWMNMMMWTLSVSRNILENSVYHTSCGQLWWRLRFAWLVWLCLKRDRYAN